MDRIRLNLSSSPWENTTGCPQLGHVPWSNLTMAPWKKRQVSRPDYAYPGYVPNLTAGIFIDFPIVMFKNVVLPLEQKWTPVDSYGVIRLILIKAPFGFRRSSSLNNWPVFVGSVQPLQ